MVSYEWCGLFRGAELSALHAAGFGQPAREHDWQAQVREHSVSWVCARDGAGLASFVNVAGTAARTRSSWTPWWPPGCAWLHVDFEPELGPFYWASCGFRPATAGLLAL